MPTIQSLKGQREVKEERAVEQDGPERIAPQPLEPLASLLHSLDRHESEGVVAEVGQKKRPEHQP